MRTGLGLNAQINLRARSSIGRTISTRICRRLPDQPVPAADRRRGRDRDRCRTARRAKIGIERLHLEQDAGKSLHDQPPQRDLRRSQPLGRRADGDRLRAGHALAEEAAAYLHKLRSILRYLGTCDGNMEEGSMRCDVNVSVRRAGDDGLGTRCEIKNVNSMRFVQQAIEYEARRQIEILEGGGTIDQETRLFDPRRRRDAHDALQGRGARLSLFPRSGSAAARARRRLGRAHQDDACPNCRTTKKARFVSDYGLSPYDAGVLVGDSEPPRLFRDGRQGPRRQASPPTG